jgi:hypothetical protein
VTIFQLVHTLKRHLTHMDPILALRDLTLIVIGLLTVFSAMAGVALIALAIWQ